jgi:hypothetical protein
VDTDVSEEHIAPSKFDSLSVSVEIGLKSSTLQVEACLSETSVSICKSTQYQHPEDQSVNNQHLENMRTPVHYLLLKTAESTLCRTKDYELSFIPRT